MGIASRTADFSPSARHGQVSVSSGQAWGGQGRQARYRTVSAQRPVSGVRPVSPVPPTLCISRWELLLSLRGKFYVPLPSLCSPRLLSTSGSVLSSKPPELGVPLGPLAVLAD